MKNTVNPTASVMLYTPKMLSGGKHPIRLRITYLRVRKYYSLKISATKEEWGNILIYDTLKSKDPLRDILYDTITIIRETNLKSTKLLQRYENEGIHFSFEKFENDYFEEKPQSIYTLLEKTMATKFSDEKFGTYRTYKNLNDALKKFRPNQDISFHQINYEFLKNFERFLSKGVPSKKEGVEPKGNGATSIGIYMRNIRALFNEAIRNQIIKSELYPFKTYKIRGGTPHKRALHKNQVLQIYTYNPEPNSTYWFSKTYFMFSYLCQGMNFVDMANLKWSENIKDDRIEYQRKKTISTLKTPKIISIKITDEISLILSFFKKSDTKNSDYIFPIIDKDYKGKQLRDYILDKNKKHNETLKEIGKELKIELPLTSYVARHSYATVLKRSNVPTSVISESLGHSSESVTQNYLDSFEKSVIDDANKNLL